MGRNVPELLPATVWITYEVADRLDQLHADRRLAARFPGRRLAESAYILDLERALNALGVKISLVAPGGTEPPPRPEGCEPNRVPFPPPAWRWGTDGPRVQ